MGLAVEGLVKYFGPKIAVNQLNLSLSNQVIHGIIGPNGAGKTTTMRIVLRMMDYDQGDIRWNNLPLANVPRERFAYVPEERGLFPKMGLEEQLVFFGTLWGLTRHDASQKAKEWIDRLELGPYRQLKAAELSKGNARKAQIAVALVAEPELLILDEPFEGLDPVNVRLLKQILAEAKSAGSTVLLSSHTMEFVEDLCENITLIAGGTDVLQGSIQDVRETSRFRILQVRYQGAAAVQAYTAFENQYALHPIRILFDRSRWYQISRQEASLPWLERVQKWGQLSLFSVAAPSLEDIYVETVVDVARREKPVSTISPAGRYDA